MLYTWARKHPDGYECSSKGDKRFSALYARMQDGRTIEAHYQCDIKGYDPGGSLWRLGKGKPPLLEMTEDDLYEKYLALWREWAYDNIDCMRDLYRNSKESKILTDCFASGPVNQARALSDILNELIGGCNE